MSVSSTLLESMSAPQFGISLCAVYFNGWNRNKLMSRGRMTIIRANTVLGASTHRVCHVLFVRERRGRVGSRSGQTSLVYPPVAAGNIILPPWIIAFVCVCWCISQSTIQCCTAWREWSILWTACVFSTTLFQIWVYFCNWFIRLYIMEKLIHN
jgi:hypothetical protein